MKNNNSLFYVCSLLEYIGRLLKLERSELVRQLGKHRIKRLYKDAGALHCEPIEKIAAEVVSVYGVKGGTFDNVSRCLYEVPDYWTIGEVYERLIEDICAENDDVDFIAGVVLQVYTSWIDKAISNYNTDFFISPGTTYLSAGKRGRLSASNGRAAGCLTSGYT